MNPTSGGVGLWAHMLPGQWVGGRLPRPHIGNRRARFYFTEAGWHKIGRAVLMDARRRGIMVRVVRLKNPPLSQAIYRDKWQVAILPPGRRRPGGGQAE